MALPSNPCSAEGKKGSCPRHCHSGSVLLEAITLDSTRKAAANFQT